MIIKYAALILIQLYFRALEMLVLTLIAEGETYCIQHMVIYVIE